MLCKPNYVESAGTPRNLQTQWSYILLNQMWLFSALFGQNSAERQEVLGRERGRDVRQRSVVRFEPPMSRLTLSMCIALYGLRHQRPLASNFCPSAFRDRSQNSREQVWHVGTVPSSGPTQWKFCPAFYLFFFYFLRKQTQAVWA